MLKLVSQIADQAHPLDVDFLYRRKQVLVVGNQEGNVGEVDQILRRRATQQRLPPLLVAFPIAPLSRFGEHVLEDPIRAIFLLEDRRDVPAHRITVDDERTVCVTSVREAVV